MTRMVIVIEISSLSAVCCCVGGGLGGFEQSVSAFSPICHPSVCSWGKKAFTGYLGADENAWKVSSLLLSFSPSLLLSFSPSLLLSFSPSLLLVPHTHTCISQAYDATVLLESYNGPKDNILIDQVCTNPTNPSQSNQSKPIHAATCKIGKYRWVFGVEAIAPWWPCGSC